MAVPLKSGDMVYGVLELIDTKYGEPFTKRNLTDFAAIAEGHLRGS